MKEITKEIVTVMVGILIALLINNWNDERKEKKYLDQIYVSIQNEIQESIDDIKTQIPRQIASIDTVQAYMNNDEVSIYQILLKSNGIHGPNIKTNSWKALANSKIELIEYDRLSALADIEGRTSNLSQRLDRQVDFIYQNFEATDKGKKEIFRMILADIIGAEQSLIRLMEDVIEKYPANTTEE